MQTKPKVASFLLAVLLVVLCGCAPGAGPAAGAREAVTPAPVGTESMPAATSGVPPTHPLAAPDAPPGVKPVDTRTRDREGMVMVYVPAGQFEMGSEHDPRARPVHRVALDPFWIDLTEVTNAMFATFLNELGNQTQEGVSWLEPGAGHRGIVYGHIKENEGVFVPQAGYEDYPVIEVSWYGAAAYCAWAGGRLPTEAEWAYAARGPQAAAYPWGDRFEGWRANYCDVNCTYAWRDPTWDDGAGQWTAVGRYPSGASWCGALDMAGNVWEWVSDWWSEAYYAHSPAGNPPGPESGTLHVARGASWFDEGRDSELWRRKGLTASSSRMHWVGFRCVVPAQDDS